jgi:hypothetical protein
MGCCFVNEEPINKSIQISALFTCQMSKVATWVQIKTPDQGTVPRINKGDHKHQ